MPYDNIAAAVSGKAADYQRQVDNYAEFSRLSGEGVYLPDVMKELEDLRAKVRASEADGRDDALFRVMEDAVSDDPDVRAAAQKLEACRRRVLERLCMEDAAYREASEGYRRLVNERYVGMREGGTDRWPR